MSFIARCYFVLQSRYILFEPIPTLHHPRIGVDDGDSIPILDCRGLEACRHSAPGLWMVIPALQKSLESSDSSPDPYDSSKLNSSLRRVILEFKSFVQELPTCSPFNGRASDLSNPLLLLLLLLLLIGEIWGDGSNVDSEKNLNKTTKMQQLVLENKKRKRIQIENKSSPKFVVFLTSQLPPAL